MQDKNFDITAALSQPQLSTANRAPAAPDAPNDTLYIGGEISGSDAAIKKAAEDFEAAFITQVLIHSGLDKALTMNGGEQMQAFSGFYLEAIAKDMVANGGLGLAETFYDKLKTDSEMKGSGNDDHGRL